MKTLFVKAMLLAIPLLFSTCAPLHEEAIPQLQITEISSVNDIGPSPTIDPACKLIDGVFEVEDCKVRLSTIYGWKDCDDVGVYEFNWEYSPGVFSIKSTSSQPLCIGDFNVWNDQCRKGLRRVELNEVEGGTMLIAELNEEFQLCMIECCGTFNFSFRGDDIGDPF